MRIFTDMVTMIEEIRRDLSKSHVLVSSRVQATDVELMAHESMNYQYAIHASAMPEDAYGLASIGTKYFKSWENVVDMVAWLAIEGEHRFSPLSKSARLGSNNSESYHPVLRDHSEGQHYAYTYRERMIGFLPAMESVLAKDLYSRRAFWPIFEQRDSHRASDFTRVPCSLGLHFMVRHVKMETPKLHVTNLQRSCDFSVYWLSDLWFTHLAQKLLAKRLDLDLGLIHHHIMSFHSFIEGEIY